MTYTIHAKILPLTTLAGHAYLEIFDKKGERVCQINGFATDVRTQKSKAVGAPWDQIKAYISKHAILAVTENATADKHVHKGFKLADIEDINALNDLMSALQKRADEINAMQLRYKLLSQNSNTIFAEMLIVIAEKLSLPLDDFFKQTLSIQAFLPGLQTRLQDKSLSPQAPKPKKYKP
jgi:hypothetical protein